MAKVRDAVTEALTSTLQPLLARSIVATLPPSADREIGSLDVVAGYELLRYVAAGTRILASGPLPDLLEVLRRRVGGDQPFRPTTRVLTVYSDHDVVTVQDATQKILRNLFKPTDCVRVATAVSELARNIYLYAQTGEIRLQLSESDGALTFQVVASDHGPGIPRLEEVLAGTYRSRTGLGKGLLGAKTLLDDLDIQTGSQGTTIRGTKRTPVPNLART